SVVAARTGCGRHSNTARLTHPRAASREIKAIPRRKPASGRMSFLSCRGAVIVDADNIRVGGHWTQPKAVLVGIRLRKQPGFRYAGVLYDFRITPCRGEPRRVDVLGHAGFRPASAAAIAAAATPGGPQQLRAG